MPISKAIQCSTALPIVYKPVELKGRQLVDGGIRSTTNVDIAVEKGRQVHRRRQPARPLRQRLREDDPDGLRHAACGASPTWACRRSPTRPSA